MYSVKFGIDEKKMQERLWGDQFFDAKAKKWVRKDVGENGEQLKRSFCQFCIEPLRQIYHAVLSEDKEKIEKILKAISVTLTDEERETTPTRLVRVVLKKFMPLGPTVLKMVVNHLPSPLAAQQYRAELLYSGPADTYRKNIQECSPNAPLIIYVSKIVPIWRGTSLSAFGRVFSGTLKAGHKVRIMGSNYKLGKRADLFENKSIPRPYFNFGRVLESADEMPAGNLLHIGSVAERYILKSATICDDNEIPHPFRDSGYSVAPLVRVTVKPTSPLDLPKLIEGLKRLAKVDPSVSCSIEETGELVIGSPSRLHLETCVGELKDIYSHGIKIEVSEPLLALRETVTMISDRQCLAKSGNRHNRLYCKGMPVTEELAKEIEEENSVVVAGADPRDRAEYLSSKFGWDLDQGRKIWSYGHDGWAPNLLVDATKGVVSNMNEVRDFVIMAWRLGTTEGVLSGSELRGVRMNIEDMTTHADAIHRGAGQFVPAARRVIQGCCLTATPRLMEPMCIVEILAPFIQVVIEEIRNVINRRNGVVLTEEVRSGNHSILVTARLLGADTDGLEADLRAHTQGNAYCRVYSEGWKVVESDPFVQGSLACNLVLRTRTMLGLDPTIPNVDKIVDEL
eukprot:GILJ01025253.1.p1 GENE.GILJ01025253.1~~GILJ01025253.1.p1  ORF type:complete len:624 (-),score=49.81 GILJ01025253.1:116-1987(-)